MLNDFETTKRLRLKTQWLRTPIGEGGAGEGPQAGGSRNLTEAEGHYYAIPGVAAGQRNVDVSNLDVPEGASIYVDLDRPPPSFDYWRIWLYFCMLTMFIAIVAMVIGLVFCNNIVWPRCVGLQPLFFAYAKLTPSLPPPATCATMRSCAATDMESFPSAASTAWGARAT